MFSGYENVTAKTSYTEKGKRILCFKDSESLVQRLQEEARAERTISEEVARKVWRLSRAMDPE